MKKLLALLTLVLIVFVVVNRERLFLWDLIASVSRNGVKQSGVRVMINYSNDVLVEDKSSGERKLYLVQNWDKTAKFSLGPLKCIQYLACLADADHASGYALARSGPVTMTNKSVEFTDETGSQVVVKLR